MMIQGHTNRNSQFYLAGQQNPTAPSAIGSNDWSAKGKVPSTGYSDLRICDPKGKFHQNISSEISKNCKELKTCDFVYCSIVLNTGIRSEIKFLLPEEIL